MTSPSAPPYWCMCAVCHDVLTDPLTCPSCATNHCMPCLFNWIGHEETRGVHGTCPSCRSAYPPLAGRRVNHALADAIKHIGAVASESRNHRYPPAGAPAGGGNSAAAAAASPVGDGHFTTPSDCTAFEDYSSTNRSTSAVGRSIGRIAGDFSLVMLVRPSSRTYGMVASKDRSCVGTNQFRFEMHESGNVALAALNVPGGRPGPRSDSTDRNGYSFAVTSSGALPLGIWTHLAVTREGGVLTLYVNGLADCIIELDPCIHDNDLDMRIGSRYPPGSGNGQENAFQGDIRKAIFLPRCLGKKDINNIATAVLHSS